MSEEQNNFQNIDPEEVEAQEAKTGMDAPQFGGDLGVDADIVTPLLGSENPWEAAYEKMRKDIRGWGWSSIILGVIHVISFGTLDPSWGISLLAVGALSFLISEASMFVIYAVIMAWVGVSNILAVGLGTWTFFGLLQVYWSYTLYRKFQTYSQLEQKYLESMREGGVLEQKTQRAARLFPGAGCLMGLVGVGGVLGVFLLLLVVMAQNPGGSFPDNIWLYDLAWGVFFACGILGFSLSVAAVVAKYKQRVLAWGGVAAGVLLIVFELFLRFAG